MRGDGCRFRVRRVVSWESLVPSSSMHRLALCALEPLQLAYGLEDPLPRERAQLVALEGVVRRLSRGIAAFPAA
jgi:hypothetical protein